MKYLKEAGCISETTVEAVKDYLKTTQVGQKPLNSSESKCLYIKKNNIMTVELFL